MTSTGGRNLSAVKSLIHLAISFIVCPDISSITDISHIPSVALFPASCNHSPTPGYAVETWVWNPRR